MNKNWTDYVLQIFRIKPPMCITKEDADFAIDVFKTAVQKQQKTVKM
jgi:4-aminobutyrate aminotransferase-like enzyme